MDLSVSICRSGYFHRWDIVGASSIGVLERCQICHKKKSYRIVDGTINNKEYLSYHMRSALQKDHRKFEHEYAR